ncbi:aminotransferase [Ktedonobacter sp. SOSP1-85]|uniref:pyridoxal phosphate-dependent aminotransferase n=1 Tax=Ktedonobacter sp. SOSP1-85 TaxID=2778367 RepID=UPI0019155B8F|nr:histidinol-phosphate transaminase [Ktedonobacter sp. SOSP1-85]GHO80763.1 aminotransferase [Ktedonobacter sp. SOSP1-85]
MQQHPPPTKEQLDGRELPVHGALDYGELERLDLRPEEIHDFSVNANPYGPSPVARQALAGLALERYPDRACLALKRALLRYEIDAQQVGIEWLVCGNGASELIWSIARTFLYPGAAVAQLMPTFGEYQAASQAVGASVSDCILREEDDFQVDIPEVIQWLRRLHPALFWLCNPNNPTGEWLPPMKLRELARACAELGTLLVIDESYRHFLFPAEEETALELAQEEGQVIVLRSLTKDFALAALRIGYAVAPPELAAKLATNLPAWNVNGAAQVVATAVLADREHLAHSLQGLAREREAFFGALQGLGCRVVPTRTHYALVRVGNARQLREALLQGGLLVRDCTSFGLPQYIRVATRQAHEWSRLAGALGVLQSEEKELWEN